MIKLVITMKKIQVELCIGTYEDFKALEGLPIDRIELNHALELGGLTPSIGLLKQIKAETSLPILCMVRPHAHGFHYCKQEIELMIFDAKQLLEQGADGIVFGFLNEDLSIDEISTKLMTDLIHSYKKEAVFHKAFDQTANLEEAVKTLISCHVDRILTEGGNHQGQIEYGLPTLARLIQNHQNDIEILPGGGVRAHNVQHIVTTTKCNQIHTSCKEVHMIDGLTCVKTGKEKVVQFLEQLK